MRLTKKLEEYISKKVNDYVQHQLFEPMTKDCEPLKDAFKTLKDKRLKAVKDDILKSLYTNFNNDEFELVYIHWRNSLSKDADKCSHYERIANAFIDYMDDIADCRNNPSRTLEYKKTVIKYRAQELINHLFLETEFFKSVNELDKRINDICLELAVL